MAWFILIERFKPNYRIRAVQLNAETRSRAAWTAQFRPPEMAKGETSIGIVEAAADSDPAQNPVVFRYLSDPRAYGDDDEEPEDTAHIVRVIGTRWSSRSLCNRKTRGWDGPPRTFPTSLVCAKCTEAGRALGLAFAGPGPYDELAIRENRPHDTPDLPD